MRVTSAEGFVAALEKCKAGNYDLLVLGHSIPYTDKEALAVEINRQCPTPILALLRTGEPELESAAESVDVSNPQLLLDAVARLLAKRPKAD